MSSPSGWPFDLLTDVMEQVRLEGTVYFHAELHSPWGLSIEREGRSPFYAVTEGRCELRVLGVDSPLPVGAGDFVLLPHGTPHTVDSEAGVSRVDFDDFFAAHPMDERGRIVRAGPGELTRVTGGFFSAGSLRSNPLLTALPPVIHLKGDSPQVQNWLAPTLHFIEAEIENPSQGSRTVLRRLADVLFIQAVRAVLAAAPPDASGWLRGLSDVRVARALALIHENYAQPWTMASLARAAGMSRTLLAVRFRSLVGD
ncbi:MAG: AraC family transcriptional regulator, partial [Burkholderiaceae bacterium]